MRSPNERIAVARGSTNGATLRRRCQFDQKHVLSIPPAILTEQIGAERLLPVRREDHPPPVLRHVWPRLIPERQSEGIEIIRAVAAVVSETPDRRAHGRR